MSDRDDPLHMDNCTLEQVAARLGPTNEKGQAISTRAYIELLGVGGRGGPGTGEIRDAANLSELPEGETLRVLTYRDEAGLALRWLSNRRLDPPEPEPGGKQMRARSRRRPYMHWNMHPPNGDDRRTGYLKRSPDGTLSIQG